MQFFNRHLVASSIIAVLALSGCNSKEETTTTKTKEDVSKALAQLNQTTQAPQSENGSIVKCANIKSKLVTEELLSISQNDEMWKEAPASTVMLYGQKTIRSIDKKENEHMAHAKALKATAKALYNDKTFAVRISWDDSEKTQGAQSPTAFADGIAMQFAVDYSNPAKLPYIGMGSEGRPVVIHLQKSGISHYEPNGNHDVKNQYGLDKMNKFDNDIKAYKAKAPQTDYEKMFVAEGFRTLSEIKDGTATGSFSMNYANGQWTAVLIRPLKDKYVDLHAQSFPMAFAIWNGKRANRGSSKFLSSWVTVGQSQSEFAATLAHVPTGNIAEGKQKAIENCAGCHNFDGQDNGMPFMAPDMSNLGGQASAAYIKESIIDPSSVIVPGYNRNAHPSHVWYNVVDGKRVSTMPAFDWMTPADINDIVAYFKTLR